MSKISACVVGRGGGGVEAGGRGVGEGRGRNTTTYNVSTYDMHVCYVVCYVVFFGPNASKGASREAEATASVSTPLHGTTPFGVTATVPPACLNCGPRVASIAGTTRSQTHVATVALKGSAMESKLAFAVEPTGLHEAFTRMGFARADFGFVILEKN